MNRAQQLAGRLGNASVDLTALVLAVVSFAAVHKLLKLATTPTPFGPLLYRVREFPKKKTSWLERLFFGDMLSFARHPPGVTAREFTAEARRELNNPAAQAYFFLGPFSPRITLSNAHDVRYVLLDAPEKFQKDELALMLVPLVGSHGLVTIIDEDYHTVQRKAVAHAFGSSSVKAIASTTMREHFMDMIRELQMREATLKGEPQCLNLLFDSTALKIISESAFNTTNFTVLKEALRDVKLIFGFHPAAVLGARIMNKLPLRRNRIAASIRRLARSIADRTFAAARAPSSADDNGEKKGCRAMLIDLLIHNSKLSPDEIFDHTITFLFAGHETTATALMWVCVFLATHQAVQQSLHDELDSAFAVGVAPSTDLLSTLPFLNAVLYETLRIQPPVPVVVRTPKHDMVLPATSTFVPAGTGLSINIVNLHRDPAVYGPDVDEFRPQRWIDDPDLMSRAQPCNWMPFLVGKRSCIGRDFAMHELAMGVALMARNFHVAWPENAKPVEAVHGVIVKPPELLHFLVALRH